MRRILVSLLACGVAASMPVSSHAASAKLPDLRVVDAGVLTPTLAPGARSVVKVTVRNAGRAASKPTTVSFALSNDAKLGHDAPLRGLARVGVLKPGASVTVTGSLTIGARVKVGAYRVFACVDPRHVVAESSDRNNCPAGERVGVLAKPHAQTVAPVAAPGVTPAEQTIDINGGSVSVLGADGSTWYTLVVPARALAAPTRITITPLASIGGLPFAAGLGGGVLLEPSGLEFARPATLVIAGANVTPSSANVSFSFEGSGSDFHTTPQWQAVPSGATIGQDPAHSVYIAVQHFSGVGFAPATSNEEAVQDVKRSVASRNDLERQAADATKDGHIDPSKLQAYYDAYMDQVLLPEAAAAAYSDGLYVTAVRDYIGWIRNQQLTGTNADTTSGLAGVSLDGHWKSRNGEFNRLMDLAWKQVVVRLERDCRAGRFDTLGRIIGLERERQLLGVGEDSTPNQFTAALKRCMHFDLSLETEVFVDQSGGGLGSSVSEKMRWHLASHLPLQLAGDATALDVATAHMTGEAALPYTVHEQTGTGSSVIDPYGTLDCTYSFAGQTQAGMLTVLDSSFEWQAGSRPRPTLSFTLGSPSEMIHHDCHGTMLGQAVSDSADEQTTKFLTWWRSQHGGWSTAGDNVAGPDDNGPWSVRLEPGVHPIVGQLTVDRVNPGYGLSFHETWTLTHTPLPAPKG